MGGAAVTEATQVLLVPAHPSSLPVAIIMPRPLYFKTNVKVLGGRSQNSHPFPPLPLNTSVCAF